MTKGPAAPALAEAEYWRIYDLIRGDVEAAIKTNYANLAVNRLAFDEPEIHEKFNKFPDFWRVTTYSLQRAFFLAIGRLFDKRRDSHSVQKLVEATINNPSLFSKVALRARKRKSIVVLPSDDPPWLVDYLANAWEPMVSDLEALRTALIPHYKKFQDVFEPVRHKAIAHNSMEDESTIWEMVGKVLVADIAELLGFLHTLLWAIWQMAWNAKRLDLSDFSDYQQYVETLNSKTEQFIRQIR